MPSSFCGFVLWYFYLNRPGAKQQMILIEASSLGVERANVLLQQSILFAMSSSNKVKRVHLRPTTSLFCLGTKATEVNGVNAGRCSASWPK
jgi:hypothetical protein